MFCFLFSAGNRALITEGLAQRIAGAVFRLAGVFHVQRHDVEQGQREFEQLRGSPDLIRVQFRNGTTRLPGRVSRRCPTQFDLRPFVVHRRILREKSVTNTGCRRCACRAAIPAAGFERIESSCSNQYRHFPLVALVQPGAYLSAPFNVCIHCFPRGADARPRVLGQFLIGGNVIDAVEFLRDSAAGGQRTQEWDDA